MHIIICNINIQQKSKSPSLLILRPHVQTQPPILVSCVLLEATLQVPRCFPLTFQVHSILES